MSISDEDLEAEKSQYSACFERYRHLKEHDAAKEAYWIESKQLFDPNGDRIDGDYSSVFGDYADEIIKVLEDPDADSAIYLRNHDDEEDYEIIAVLS